MASAFLGPVALGIPEKGPRPPPPPPPADPTEVLELVLVSDEDRWFLAKLIILLLLLVLFPPPPPLPGRRRGLLLGPVSGEWGDSRLWKKLLFFSDELPLLMSNRPEMKMKLAIMMPKMSDCYYTSDKRGQKQHKKEMQPFSMAWSQQTDYHL